jgi:Tfp pilus assembly protein FimT
MRNKKRLKDSTLRSPLSTLRSPLSTLRSPKGFTAIEAVIIVVILGILTVSAVVSYRLTNQDKATIAADQLIADIQYVQMRAMGIGSQQSISFTNGSGVYTVAGEQKNLPGGITVTSPSNILTFNTLGEPTFGTTNQTITLSGPRTITIYAITGKVE